jgi:hypothetical protein
MTIYVAHRQNTLKNLESLIDDNIKSIEIDLRTNKNKIIISHDPFLNGLEFFKNIKKLKNFFLIIDFKSTGFSEKVLKILIKEKINFLFLNLIGSEQDYLIKKLYSKNLFLRFSSIEKPNLNIRYFKKIKWVWFDFFNEKLITLKEYNYIKKYKKNICLTSPDLIDNSKLKTLKYIKYLNKKEIKIDMVCTKRHNIKLWRKYYKF